MKITNVLKKLFQKVLVVLSLNLKNQSDYFHLVKNSCDYLREYLIRKLPKLLEIDGFFYEGKISINQSLIKTKHQYGNEWELIEKIKKMYADGNNYSSIGKIFNLQYRTINRYLNENTTIITEKFKVKNNNFFRFKSEIINLLNKGLKKDEVYEAIKLKGYKYALRTFYHHILIIIKDNANEIISQ